MAKQHVQQWLAHAARTKKVHKNDTLTPTQQSLLAWADKHSEKLDGLKAEEELRALGFYVEAPPPLIP